jgi:hypothetical protein
MNSKHLLAVAAIAAAFAGGVQADEADGSHLPLQVQSTRTRAEVMAEAAKVPTTRSTEPAGSRVSEIRSNADAATVRAQAAEAVRLGKIPSGERSI